MKRFVLPVIVLAQFLCTTLWFVGNAVMPAILTDPADQLLVLGQQMGVQFGFIIGTLSFALLTITDRFSPSKVFFINAILGAICNAGIIYFFYSPFTLIMLRLLTGFFLAGIYPVGMKLAADHFDKGLGKSLGLLVGALVLGTALPHLLTGWVIGFQREYVVMCTSVLALTGGILVRFLVPDGPYRRSSGEIDLSEIGKIFQSPGFRSAAFGYFGHMWELYTFWAFVPILLNTYISQHGDVFWNVDVWSFAIIGVGSLACAGAGYLSVKLGERKTASYALAASGVCCLLSPIVFETYTPELYLLFMLFWGTVVVGDSPMFSTLAARSTLPHQRGTALTIMNCIGFSITIVSIQVAGMLIKVFPVQFLFFVIAIGPALGLLALATGRKKVSDPAF